MPEEKRENGAEEISQEMIAENCPKLVDTKSQIQEAQRTISPNSEPKHIISEQQTPKKKRKY